MRKLRFYFDKDKEEKWLNKMCQKGWAMTGFCLGVYTFEPCEPGEYIYRIDMPGEIGKDNMRDRKREQYVEFVEETGAEHICDWFWWTFFRRKASQGEFKLYTDPESQLTLYKRILKLFLWVGILELAVGINNTRVFAERGISNLDAADMVCLALIYIIILVFIVAITKTTRKIKRIKKQIVS